jgi:hypothetical protein
MHFRQWPRSGEHEGGTKLVQQFRQISAVLRGVPYSEQE